MCSCANTRHCFSGSLPTPRVAQTCGRRRRAHRQRWGGRLRFEGQLAGARRGPRPRPTTRCCPFTDGLRRRPNCRGMRRSKPSSGSERGGTSWRSNMRELMGLLGFGPCPALFDAEVSVTVHSPAASAAATWVWAGAGRIGRLATPEATCHAYCQWCGLAGHRYRGRAWLLGRLRAADSADSPAGSSSLPAAVEVLSTIHPAGPTRPPKAPRSAGRTPTCSARAGGTAHADHR